MSEAPARLRPARQRPLPPLREGDRLEPDLATSIAEQKAAALRRITELSEVEELPTRRRSYRVPKLAAAIATWGAVAILVADVQLYDWTVWLL